MSENPTAGHNLGGAKLRSFIERIERLMEEKNGLSDDIAAVFAEAKSAGFVPKIMRGVIKRRAAKPQDVQEYESLRDTYLHALGMAKEAPLFTHVGLMDVDLNARESVIEALKMLVPRKGEIIVKIGKRPVRLWRDKDGDAHSEDYNEAPPASDSGMPPGAPARGRKREVPEEHKDATDAEAYQLGRQAARDNEPIVANIFPFGDARRARWDEGWRAETGSDGMGPAPTNPTPGGPDDEDGEG